MILVTADNLPWYLIGVLVTALIAVFYSMLRGQIMSRRVVEMLRESERRRAEVAEAGMEANTKSVQSLGDSVGKLIVLAENQATVLEALKQQAARRDNRNRGGTS